MPENFNYHSVNDANRNIHSNQESDQSNNVVEQQNFNIYPSVLQGNPGFNPNYGFPHNSRPIYPAYSLMGLPTSHYFVPERSRMASPITPSFVPERPQMALPITPSYVRERFQMALPITSYIVPERPPMGNPGQNYGFPQMSNGQYPSHQGSNYTSLLTWCQCPIPQNQTNDVSEPTLLLGYSSNNIGHSETTLFNVLNQGMPYRRREILGGSSPSDAGYYRNSLAFSRPNIDINPRILQGNSSPFYPQRSQMALSTTPYFVPERRQMSDRQYPSHHPRHHIPDVRRHQTRLSHPSWNDSRSYPSSYGNFSYFESYVQFEGPYRNSTFVPERESNPTTYGNLTFVPQRGSSSGHSSTVRELEYEQMLISNNPDLFSSDQDRFEHLRMDIDNLSYEDLLALQEHIGYVRSGLREETIMKLLKRRNYEHVTRECDTLSDADICPICKEEYVEGEDIGVLQCSHEFHTECITKWLVTKNKCPICFVNALNVRPFVAEYEFGSC
ncbi:uncharacterized protein LOC130825285 [Amaranthus tricolor]|uniref:uncharacterized protein LOC130825285 n=1 Tax=Amaranthus tricolor TaxID=29722 RepID=UPI00258E21B3|nr:uncharacterized protein LOC130825285 [Amaranthus tricolor]